MSRAARVRTVTSESPRSAAMSRKEARPLRSALIIARLVSSSLIFMTFRWVGDLRKPGCTPRTSTLFARTFLSKKDSPFHFFIQQKFLISLLLTIFFTDNPYRSAFLGKTGEKAIKSIISTPFFSLKVSFFAKTARASDIKIFPKTFTPIEKKRQDNPFPSFGASPVWAAAPRRKPSSAPAHREEEQAPLSNGQFRPYGGVGR